MVKSNPLCPGCLCNLNESNTSYFYSLAVCQSCGALLKKHFRELTPQEKLKVASFLQFWAYMELGKLNK